MNIKSKLIDGIGLWSEVLTKNNYNGKPALFIDRDGTFIEDKGYLSNPKNIQLIELSCSFIKKCNDNLIPVIVVTNQSGIGRGYYSWKEFYEVEITIRKKYPPYKNLEPLKVYGFNLVKELQELTINTIIELESYNLAKDKELENDNTQYVLGLKLGNLVK